MKATSEDYLKAILELLIRLGQHATGKDIVVRVGYQESGEEFADNQPDPCGNVVFLEKELEP
jgi:hypothetical protein